MNGFRPGVRAHLPASLLLATGAGIVFGILILGSVLGSATVPFI